MTTELNRSLLVRSIKNTGAAMEAVGPWVPIPWLGAAGQVIKNLPVEEGIEWGHVLIKKFGQTAPEQPVAGAAVVKQEATAVATIAQAAKPVIVAAESERQVKDQITEAVDSEPFNYALEAAIKELPVKLSEFMAHTSTSLKVGIWPAFVLERVAQAHFQSQLATSVAAEMPEVANLIEKGLAQEAVELLRLGISTNAKAKPPGFALQSGIVRIRVWTDETKFKWPALGTLSPGYFVARHEISLVNDANAANAEKERAELLARLGRMARVDLENLTQGWNEACDALLFGAGPMEKIQTHKGLPQLVLPKRY
jgi:hypothetical protein